MSKGYVCFDIGNVLYHIDFNPLITRLSKEFNVANHDVYRFLLNNQKKCDLGITSVEEEMSHHFNVRSETLLKELSDLWDNCVAPQSDMIDMLYSLHSDGYVIALLSNIGYEHKKLVSNRLTSFINFFSCDVGARKPTMLYYKTFMDLHPEFKGAPYIDDLSENLEVGKQFGLTPIKFELGEKPPHTDMMKEVNFKVKVDMLKREITRVVSNLSKG